ALSFIPDAQSSTPVTRGLEVWPIGRWAVWNVPVNPGKISGVNPADGHITVEGLDVRQGDSGGPVVSKDGIVGMILATGGAGTEVLPIDVIQKVVAGEWHYAWQLRPAHPIMTTQPKPPNPPATVSSPLIVFGKAQSVCGDLKALVAMSEQDF